MVPQPTAAVTPSGVRDGDPPTLAALAERRGRAVLAYCERVCTPGEAVAAASDALARFRRSVADANDPLSLDPEQALLRATRYAAAAHAPAFGEPAPRHGLLGRRGGACAIVPELLAARASGDLTEGDRARLARHLERCPSCQAAEERFRAGEMAYISAPDTAPEQPVTTEFMRALLQAAPNPWAGDGASNGARRNGAMPPRAAAANGGSGASRAATPAAEPAAAEAPDAGAPTPPAPGVTATVPPPEPAAAPESLAAAGATPPPADAVAPSPAASGQPSTLSWEASEVEAAVAAAAAGGPITRVVVPGAVIGSALALAIVGGGAFAKDDSVAPVVGPSAALPIPNLHPPRPPVSTPLPGRAAHAAPAKPPAKKTAPGTTTAASSTTTATSAAAPAPATRTTTITPKKPARARPAAPAEATSAPPTDSSASADDSGFQPAP